jgi:hypothetical protein
MAILRKLFGPSREEVWRQLSAAVGGEYLDGGWWKQDKVEVRHGEWIVTLDVYVVSNGKSSQTYTRMRAPYVNLEGFRFTIYRHGFFSDIGKWLGMQDVEVGHPQFDRDFIIKGSSEARLRELFSNERVRTLIARQPDIHFSVKDDEGWFGPHFPERVDELHFTTGGVIKDVERLKLLFDLFAETLDQLCHMGSAYERAPDVRL